MGDFKNLVAWQEAQELLVRLHSVFETRRAKRYPGLRSQILRAASSISANLAEGCSKGTRQELARFAEIAYASTKEVESHLISGRNAKLLPAREFEDLLGVTDHVARLCYGLARPVRKSAAVSESAVASESEPAAVSESAVASESEPAAVSEPAVVSQPETVIR